MHSFKFRNIDDAHEYIINYVQESGDEVRDERGSIVHELRNLIVEILNPVEMVLNEPLALYGKQLISGENPGFIYTYGNRFREHFGVDQIDYVVDKLNEDKNSRRAIMVTWDQRNDTQINEVPCLIMVSFQIRDNKLYVSAVWRSQDILNAWGSNLKGLSMLSQIVAKKLNVTMGTITVQSMNAHIYQTEV